MLEALTTIQCRGSRGTRAEAAQADHRQKTLNALREVEDALVDLRQQA